MLIAQLECNSSNGHSPQHFQLIYPRKNTTFPLSSVVFVVVVVVITVQNEL